MMGEISEPKTDSIDQSIYSDRADPVAEVPQTDPSSGHRTFLGCKPRGCSEFVPEVEEHNWRAPIPLRCSLLEFPVFIPSVPWKG